MKIVKLLVENGADMNAHGVSYSTPLQDAILKEDTEIIKIFKENGANLAIKTLNYNFNSFELAMEYNSIDILKQLLHQ